MLFDGLLRECGRERSPKPSMFLSVRDEHRFRHGVAWNVAIHNFLELSSTSASIDVFPGSGLDEGKLIGTYTDDWAVQIV